MCIHQNIDVKIKNLYLGDDAGYECEVSAVAPHHLQHEAALVAVRGRDDRGGGGSSTGRTKVNLVTEEGKKLYIHSNRNNNIFVPDLEKLVGIPVAGLRVAQVVGEGVQEFPVRNGYIGRK